MSSRSSADRWASRLLLTCILWTLGDGHIISPSEPILAAAGDDVILPCQLDPAINAHNYIVEWSKPDLKPDPSTGLTSDHYVHLYLGGTEVLDMKIPAFIGRTQMFTEELKHGNLSVKILNITSADQGKYRCFVPNLMKHAAVQLVVDPDFKNRTTETPSYPGDLQTPDPRNKTDDKKVDKTRRRIWILPLFFVFLILIAIIIGFLVKYSGPSEEQTVSVKES